MKKIRTSISLDECIYNQVKQIASKEDRSFSQQVNNVLKDFLSSLNKEKAR